MNDKKIEFFIKNEKKFKEDLIDDIAKIDEKIIEKKFSHAQHGYDPEEVDKEIDVILTYYERLKQTIISIFDYTVKLFNKSNNLENEVNELKEENTSLRAEGYGNMKKAKENEIDDDKKN